MAKYNYDKSALKGLGVGAFLSEVKVREAHIAAAGDKMPQSVFNSNILAEKLHPEKQCVKIAKVVDHDDARSYTLVPDTSRGTEGMAYFRAGQYVAVELNIEGARLFKPYSICSGPKDALNGSYTLTIRRSKGGYASEYILDNWKEGDQVTISGPQGDFYYQGLRDAKHVVAMAGGSGITPFYSMACAVADGIEDFDLTILYGSRTKDTILLKEELEAVAARSNSRVKVVHVLSDEAAEGYEHGFITAELIRKYAGEEDYSLFLCGPKAMYDFADKPGFGGFMSCWWRNALCMAGGIVLIMLIEYIPFFAGIGPGADLLFGSTFGGPFMSLMIVFAPQVLVFSVLCTLAYRKTGSVYTGAFMVAAMAAWIVTGGSAMI